MTGGRLHSHGGQEMVLHELHQRRLESTFQLVEKSLDRIETLLRERGEAGIVGSVTNTLSEEQQGEFLQRIAQFRRTLQQFGNRFFLERKSVDIRQVLNAELSSAWVMLENCRPERMKGYGVEFDPFVREALEEQVERLLAQVIALRARLQF